MRKAPAVVAAAALCAAAAGAFLFARRPAGASAAPADPDAPLVLLTTTDTPPYSYRDAETGEIVGLEIDIARDAAERLGRRLEVRRAKFPELLPMVSAGEADMAASGITITDGRRQTVDFTIPYAEEGGMFLYRAEDPMPTLVRAERLRVATMDASTYDFYLTSHHIDPIRYDSYADAMADLASNRIDTVFYDSCTVRIRAAESGGKFAASPLETRENFGIALRKGNVRLKSVLDAVISERRRK